MRNPLLSLAIVSSAAGFLIGMGHCVFQVAVEGAQVVSGIVHYPYPTPFFMYQTKVWTLLHQISAVLLRGGITEVSASILLSGFMGMCSLLALTLAVYALSKNLWVALGAPFLIVKSGITNFGSVYGVSLWVADTTYGVIGLSYNFLAITLISLKRYRIGGFLLGLSLAIHPAQGILYIAATGLCFLLNHKEWQGAFEITRKFFLAGLSVSAISLAIHWALTDRVTFVYPVDFKYTSAFIRSWDGHRHPVHIFSEDIFLNMMAFLISIIWLRWFRREISATAHFLLYAFTVTALLGFIFSWMSWLPPEKLPFALVSLMPARILDFGILGFGPLLIGLLFYERHRPAVQVLILFLIPALILLREPPANLAVLLIMTIALIAVKFIRLSQSASILPLALKKYLPKMAGVCTVMVFSACFLKVTEDAYTRWIVRAARFKDWRTDPFYAAISKGQGILLTSADFNMLQLYTRRPVLLDMGALDSLPYAPEAGPLMNSILREIYGMDLLNPGGDPLSQEKVGPSLSNPLWENRRLKDWQTIGKKYGVKDVLALSEVHLQLPTAATNGEFTLYRIPDGSIPEQRHNFS